MVTTTTPEDPTPSHTLADTARPDEIAPPALPILARAFAGATVGLAIATLDGDVLLANDALAAHCAGHVGDFIATCLSAADSWQPAADGGSGLALPANVVVEQRLELADGEDRWLRVNLTPIDGDDGGPMRMMVHVEDVTADLRRARRWHDLALGDELTGLPNRRALFERLAEWLVHPDRPANCHLFYVDLDGFKVINDGLGHTAGDRLLTVISDRLRVQFAMGWVARYGGDEFVGCIAVADLPCSSRAFVRRIQQTISMPVSLPEGDVTVTACIGSTTLRPDDREPWQPVNRADRAMYRAKVARQLRG